MRKFKNKTLIRALVAVVFVGISLGVYLLTRSAEPYGKPRNELHLIVQNEMKLRELHPAFRTRIRDVIAEMKDRGLRPRIATAWRPAKEQMQTVERGASKVKFGFHNITGRNGEKQAWACDI